VNELKELLNQNWIGTLIGIAGIVIGVILWFSSRTRSRLAAQTNTLELVGPNAVLPTEIEFLFRGAKVSNVAMSRIAIWNIGNTTIKGDQIVGSDPVRIVTSEGSSILETTIRQCTRQVNGVSCVLRQGTTNEVEYRFDYLDPGDGALIQLIHTGSDIVKVLGTLRGVPKGILVGSVPKPKRQGERQLSAFGIKVMGVAFVCLGLALVALAIIGVAPSGKSSLPLAPIGALVILSGLGIFFTVRYMPPGRLSTQMTTNEPKKSVWQMEAKYVFIDPDKPKTRS
jgi:hypothetical protein